MLTHVFRGVKVLSEMHRNVFILECIKCWKICSFILKCSLQQDLLFEVWSAPFTCETSHLTCHYCDVIMGAVASQITSLTIVYSSVYSDADQRKHQSSASLAFVRGIHRRPVNSPHKWPVTRKMFPFDDVIMVGSLTRIGPVRGMISRKNHDALLNTIIVT